MTGAELLVEHITAVKGGGRRILDRLRSLGSSDAAWARSMIGAAFARVDIDGTYVPDPDGIPMAILPVCDHYDPPVPIDLVAFTFAEPWRWWTRTGMAPVINAAAVTDAWWDKRPLLVSGTPLDWLRAGCEGVVVLDWRPSTVALHLGNARRLITSSPEVAERLARVFKHDVEPPEVRLAEMSNAA